MHRFQDFYEEGEKEMLLAEVSELRDQVSTESKQRLYFSFHFHSSLFFSFFFATCWDFHLFAAGVFS